MVGLHEHFGLIFDLNLKGCSAGFFSSLMLDVSKDLTKYYLVYNSVKSYVEVNKFKYKSSYH